MTTIAGPRGSGKTTELIKLCAEKNAKGSPAAILVVDKKRAEYVADLARVMEISIPHPVTLDEMKDGAFRGSFIERILVDDADNLMRRILRHETGCHVIAMTLLRYDLESIPGVTEMRPDDSEPSEAVVDSLRRENTVAFINDRMVAGTLSWGVKPTE